MDPRGLLALTCAIRLMPRTSNSAIQTGRSDLKPPRARTSRWFPTRPRNGEKELRLRYDPRWRRVHVHRSCADDAHRHSDRRIEGASGSHPTRSDPTVAELTCSSSRATVSSQWVAQHDRMLDSTVYLRGSDVTPQQWYSSESLISSAMNDSTVTHTAVLDAW